MKHAMTLSLLVAGVCAFGGAAVAQQGSGAAAPANQGTTGTSPNDMPNDQRSAPSGSNQTYGSESSAPRKSLTRDQKKKDLENVRKAIRDASSGAGQLSGQGTEGNMPGMDRGQSTGRSGSPANAESSMGAVRHLKVYRRGDKIVLRGTVQSQEDKDRIGSVANEAANGEEIVNELKVK